MMNRCHDCLTDLGSANRYAVITRRHLTDEERAAFSGDPDAVALATFQQVYVCPDCADWYPTAVEVTAAEQGMR